MLDNLILAVTVTIQIVAGPMPCGPLPAAAGCYSAATNTIQIDYTLPAAEFKSVFLHEFAHAKYNSAPGIELWDNAPARRMKDGNNMYEKMADWFSFFLFGSRQFPRGPGTWYDFYTFGLIK